MESHARPEEYALAAKEKEHSTRIKEEVIQFRFADNDSDDVEINAWELADAIQGFAGFTEQLARSGAFGEGVIQGTKVRPPKEGSFILEFVVPVIDWIANNPTGASALGATGGGGIAYTVKSAMKLAMFDKVKDVEPVPNEEDVVKVTWKSEEVNYVPRVAWDTLQKAPVKTRKNLQKIMAPLADSADKLEVRSGNVEESSDQIINNEVEETFDNQDFRDLWAQKEEPVEKIGFFESEAVVQSIDFRPDGKWLLKVGQRDRKVAIEDTDFLRELDNGMKIGKDDTFQVTIKETQLITEGSSKSEWVVVKIRRTRVGDGEKLN